MAKTALVISAHAADFVWRCGGAIALHQKKGYEVTVVCLSFGERGRRVPPSRRSPSHGCCASLVLCLRSPARATPTGPVATPRRVTSY
jgi:hypothetical protein